MKLASCALLLLWLTSLGARAQGTSATWQGSFVADGERHRMVLQAEQSANGQWSVRSLAVDFLPDPIRVDAATFQDAHISVSANDGKGGFNAQLSSDGATVAGTWTWVKKPV